MNKKLGEKFEISEMELLSTIEACSALLAEGQDLDTGEGATQVCRQRAQACAHLCSPVQHLPCMHTVCA